MHRARLTLVLSLALVAPSARAQTPPPPSAPAPPSDAKKDEAREHFIRGTQLFDDGAWDAALAEFARSRELFPTRNATRNAAVCLRQLHRYDEALEMYETFLSEFGATLPQGEREQAEHAASEMRTLVGTIDVRVPQAASAVLVDGRPRGKTPLAPVRVAAGTHAVRVVKEGFNPFDTRVEVAGGQTVKVDAALSILAESGRLRVVEVKGRAFEIVVDGVAVGQTPWEGAAGVGDHSVVLRSPDGAPVGTQPTTARIANGQASVLSLEAEPLDAQIRVEPVPSNATVSVDGVTIGAGIWEGKVRVGQHTVEVGSAGFLAQKQEFALASGGRRVVAVKLERDPHSTVFRERHPDRLFAEADVGLGFYGSLGGDADKACASGGCSDRSRVPGPVVLGRFGYAMGFGLGLEVDVGYMSLGENATRTDYAPADDAPAPVSGTTDTPTKLKGTLLGGGASATFFDSLPLSIRLTGGVLFASVSGAGAGSYTQTIGASPVAFSTTQCGDGAPHRTSIPYASPDVRVAYKLGSHLQVTGGVSALVLFPSKVRCENPAALVPDGGPKPGVGVLAYPSRDLLGAPFVVVVPSIGIRGEI